MPSTSNSASLKGASEALNGIYSHRRATNEPADSNAIPTSEEGPIAANDLYSYPRAG